MKQRLSDKIFTFACNQPALFFGLFSLILAADLLIFGEGAIIKAHDLLRISVPYHKALFDQMLQHGIVGWLPNFGCGLPVLNSQFFWWRPETLLYFLMSPFWVYSIQHLIATFVAGFGSFQYFRRVENLSSGTSLLAGVVFTTAALTLLFAEAASWAGIPLFLYCFDQWVRGPNLRKNIIFILVCLYYVISANPIYIQPYVFLFHLTLCLRFWLFGRYDKRVISRFIFIWLVHALVLSPMVLNMLFVEYPSVGRTGISIYPKLGLSFITPLGEHNIFYLVMVVFGLLSIKQLPKAKLYAWWVILAWPFMWLWAQTISILPFLGSFQCRVNEFLPFPMVALFAFGCERFFQNRGEEKNKMLKWAIPIIILSVILALYYQFSLFNVILVLTSLIITMVVWNVFRSSKETRHVFAVALLGICCWRLIYKPIHTLQCGPNSYKFYYGLEAVQKVKELEKGGSEYYRVASYGLQPAIAAYHGLHTADMENSFYPQRYRNFWMQVLNAGEYTDWRHLKNTLLGEGIEHVQLPMPYKQNVNYLAFNPNLLALINVKYILSRVIINKSHLYGLEPVEESAMVTCSSLTSDWDALQCRIEKFFKGARASIYRVVDVFPRFYITHRARFFENEDDLYDALGRASIEELREYVYFTKKEYNNRKLKVGFDSPGRADDKITVLNYSPDDIVLKAEMAKTGYLVMTENYSERWTCLDNGNPIDIIPAYATFRALKLGVGDHDITCHFDDLLAVFVMKLGKATAQVQHDHVPQKVAEE